MSEFDRIRPYADHEVAAVVARLLTNPQLAQAAAELIPPSWLRGSALGRWVTRRVLQVKLKGLHSVDDCQRLLAHYFRDLIENTIEQLSVDGLAGLRRDKHYLFISNHRDIVMDSSLISYLLFQAGYPTCRMAVGDNLLANPVAADVMRLNKSFVVERGADGGKTGVRTFKRTSGYIRHSLEEHVSVWIAQRQGRSKDGFDRTDPAVLKMISLAYRRPGDGLASLLAETEIVPVSLSYEIDPCALRKAHELYVTEREGRYQKSEQEDVQSIVLGLMGHKGRVHVQFGKPIGMDNRARSADQLASDIDHQIIQGLRVYPTHAAAAAQLGWPAQLTPEPDCAAVMTLFETQLAQCPEAERGHLLCQYANIIKNKVEFHAT